MIPLWSAVAGMKKAVDHKLNAAESNRAPARHEKLWLKTLEGSLVGTTEWAAPHEPSDMGATHAAGWILAGIFLVALVVNSMKAKRQARGVARSGDRDVLIYRPPRH